jgi:menaquinone-9 beta-reductase
MNANRFDALVIGGGPAGATAAILLAEAGWSVAVVEQKSFPRRKVCGEYLSATNWPLLARLGIASSFTALAGPPILETAVFVGDRKYGAALPRPQASAGWGRALARDQLDTLLLARAAQLGAVVIQPARCAGLAVSDTGVSATVERDGQGQAITASIAIAAHGSWEIGPLVTQRSAERPAAADWLAFKAHFCQAALPPSLMPLLCFAGGYGGMVHVGGGRVSLSYCVQRRAFSGLLRQPGVPAGETVLTHILESCPVLRPVLAPAVLDGPWLSAGVIQPGIRPRFRGGVFVVGNAAGEAHPVVAEGISMAMQSAWLLAQRLIPHRADLTRANVREQIGRAYSADWRRAFAARIYAAAAIAQWASRPSLVRLVGPLMRAFPALVTCGARLSGKAHVVVDGAAWPATECFSA